MLMESPVSMEDSKVRGCNIYLHCGEHFPLVLSIHKAVKRLCGYERGEMVCYGVICVRMTCPFINVSRIDRPKNALCMMWTTIDISS